MSEENKKLSEEIQFQIEQTLGLSHLDNLINTIGIPCINEIIETYSIEILFELYEIMCQKSDVLKKICQQGE